jgi:glycosyltransferase involved in cell wall biosynthesis
VLFLGRINFKKGLDLLAKALGAVRRQFPDVHLVIAGPDEHGYSEQVVKWLYDEDSLDSVTFTGMVQGRRKAALLRSASMFVLSSYSENFGIAVVESMAVGLPVVISNKVNIWREVAEAGAGLVTNTDSRELACAMVHILRNPCMARQMGLKGQVLAKSKFSWSVAGDALMTLYASILGA